jgi:quercetin dioxygenase-like cupin family protein
MTALGIAPLLLIAIVSDQSEWIHLGEPFTIDKETPIQCLIEHPEEYHNKISGIIASVCNQEGCFIEIVPKDGKGEGVLVNFPGLSHTFPLDCAGREAVVEGLFYQKVYPSSRLSHWQHHSYRKGTKIPRFALIMRIAAKAVRLGGSKVAIPPPVEIKETAPNKIDLAVMEFEDEGFGIGTKRLPPGDSTPEHSTSDVREIIVCLEGSVTVFKEGSEPVTLTAGEMTFIPPATTHEVRNEGQAVASYVFIYAQSMQKGEEGPDH